MVIRFLNRRGLVFNKDANLIQLKDSTVDLNLKKIRSIIFSYFKRIHYNRGVSVRFPLQSNFLTRVISVRLSFNKIPEAETYFRIFPNDYFGVSDNGMLVVYRDNVININKIIFIFDLNKLINLKRDENNLSL